MRQAARLRLAADLEKQAWAQVEDLVALTYEEQRHWDEEFDRWCAPDRALYAIFMDKGEDALPDPFRDVERLRVRNECKLEWTRRRVVAAEWREDLANATVSEADQAKRTREAENSGELAAVTPASHWPRRNLDITGCRLVAGADNMNGGVGGVTVRFAVGEPVAVLLGARPLATMKWDEIDWIAVEALPERTRLTASRAVGLGLLSLAARKRTPWCVMTIVWGARHLVFEVPTEAHRLRGEMATAGLPIDGTDRGWSPSGLG